MISIDVATVIGILCFIVGIVVHYLVCRTFEGFRFSGAINFDISTKEHKPSFVFFEPIENFENRRFVRFKVTKYH